MRHHKFWDLEPDIILQSTTLQLKQQRPYQYFTFNKTHRYSSKMASSQIVPIIGIKSFIIGCLLLMLKAFVLWWMHRKYFDTPHTPNRQPFWLITRTHISCTDDQSSLWNWAEEIPKTCLKFQTTVLHSTKKFDLPNTNKKTSMNKQWH